MTAFSPVIRKENYEQLEICWQDETPKGENEMSDIVREIVEIECAKAAEEAAQKATEEATKETSIKNIKLLIKNGVPLSTIVTTFSYIFSESDIQKIYSECESNTIS